MKEVSFEEFQNIDMRVGKIISVETPEGSKTMYKLEVDFGNEKRTAMAGLKSYYKPEELTGNGFVFILNLERKKFLGIESGCMIFAADDGKGNIVLLQPEKEIEIGSRVR